MAIDIPQIAQGAIDKAWDAAASVLKSVTIKQGPTVVYNAVTDVSATTWAATTTVKGLLYAPKLEEVDAASMDAFVQSRMVMLLVRSTDLPSFVATNDIVEVGTVVWQIKSVFRDPSERVTILTLLR
jgi:hypothetical protein